MDTTRYLVTSQLAFKSKKHPLENEIVWAYEYNRSLSIQSWRVEHPSFFTSSDQIRSDGDDETADNNNVVVQSFFRFCYL